MLACVPGCSPPQDSLRPSLVIRSQNETSHKSTADIVGIVERIVGCPLDIKFFSSTDADSHLEVTLLPDTPKGDSIAPTILDRTLESEFTQILVSSTVEGDYREYRLIRTSREIDRFLACGAPFILWFHADWVGEGVSLRTLIFRDTTLFDLLSRHRIPIVFVDHSYPSNDSNTLLSRYSASMVVPTVVLFGEKPSQSPIVLEGLTSVQPITDAVGSLYGQINARESRHPDF